MSKVTFNQWLEWCRSKGWDKYTFPDGTTVKLSDATKVKELYQKYIATDEFSSGTGDGKQDPSESYNRVPTTIQAKIERELLHFLNENIRPDYINKVDAWNLEKSTQATTNLFIELLPSEKPLETSTAAQEPREYMNQAREIKVNKNHQAIGYNQCIDDIKAKIKDMK